MQLDEYEVVEEIALREADAEIERKRRFARRHWAQRYNRADDKRATKSGA